MRVHQSETKENYLKTKPSIEINESIQLNIFFKLETIV